MDDLTAPPSTTRNSAQLHLGGLQELLVDRSHLGFEAHIQQTICLVQDQTFDVSHLRRVRVHWVFFGTFSENETNETLGRGRIMENAQKNTWRKPGIPSHPSPSRAKRQ